MKASDWLKRNFQKYVKLFCKILYQHFPINFPSSSFCAFSIFSFCSYVCIFLLTKIWLTFHGPWMASISLHISPSISGIGIRTHNFVPNSTTACVTFSSFPIVRKIVKPMSLTNFSITTILCSKALCLVERGYVTLTFYFLKWAIRGLFVYSLLFYKQTLEFLQQNNVQKMSIRHMVLGFEPTTFRIWVSSHNH